jgi:hypothetical protein
MIASISPEESAPIEYVLHSKRYEVYSFHLFAGNPYLSNAHKDIYAIALKCPETQQIASRWFGELYMTNSHRSLAGSVRCDFDVRRLHGSTIGHPAALLPIKCGFVDGGNIDHQTRHQWQKERRAARVRQGKELSASRQVVGKTNGDAMTTHALVEAQRQYSGRAMISPL